MKGASIAVWRGILRDTSGLLGEQLFKNSLYLMLATYSSAAIGFLFWVFAARLYTESQMGIATGLLSLMAFSSLLSRVGLDSSLVRFFPEFDKGRVLGTSLIVTALFSMAIGLVVVTGTEMLSTDLRILSDFWCVCAFILFVVIESASVIVGLALVAVRRSKYYLLQSVVASSKLAFVVFLVPVGSLGIFISAGLSSVVSLVPSLYLLHKLGIKVRLSLDTEFLKHSSKFSSGSYVVGLLMVTPIWLLPVMILGTLGPEEAAQYYMPYSISSMLFLIPSAFGTSLFVEGSHGLPIKKSAYRAVLGTYALLTPAAAILWVFGGELLGIFGSNYVVGLDLLRLLVLSSFFLSVWSVYYSIMRVRKEMRTLVYIGAMISSGLLGFGYLLMRSYGLPGVGYAWVTTFGLCAAAVAIILWRGSFFGDEV